MELREVLHKLESDGILTREQVNQINEGATALIKRKVSEKETEAAEALKRAEEAETKYKQAVSTSSELQNKEKVNSMFTKMNLKPEYRKPAMAMLDLGKELSEEELTKVVKETIDNNFDDPYVDSHGPTTPKQAEEKPDGKLEPEVVEQLNEINKGE